MTCSELVELVTAFLDGALDDASEMALLVHVDGCPSCRIWLEQYRQTIRMFGEAGPARTPLPPAHAAALLAAFRDACR